MDRETRVWESIVIVLVMALSVLAWVVSASFPKGDNALVGPALFPRILGVILIVSSIAVLFKSWRPGAVIASSSSQSAAFDWLKLARTAGLVVVLALAPLALAQFGLLATTVALTVGVCFLLGSRWYEALFAGGVMLGFVYLVFLLLLKVQA